jgi:hypothetical protein
VTGRLSARSLRRWYRAIAAAALVTAWFVGPLFVLGVAVCLVCAALGVLVPRSTLVPQLLTIPVLLGAYAILTRRLTITKLGMLSVVFGIPTLGFVLAYV